MRTRREFQPVVDSMPSRISPSVAGLVQVAALDAPVVAQHAGPASVMMPMGTPGSYPILAGDPGGGTTTC